MNRVITKLAKDSQPQQVIYDNSAKVLFLNFFGHELSEIELANLVGAIENAVILVEGRGDKIFVQIKHPKLKIHDVFIARNFKNQIFIRIDEIEFHSAYRGKKEGVKMLIRQVVQAQKLNVVYIEAEADGNPKKFYRRNGYYVWARLGFDAPIPIHSKMLLPINLKFINNLGTWQETRTLNNLMLNGGHQWWRENGEEYLAFFDLNDNSNSLEVLEKYVIELRQEGKL